MYHVHENIAGVVPLIRMQIDVTTMDWNPRGDLLATGSFDGCARIWTESGSLSHALPLHKGTVFALKFNKAGNYILTGSEDRTTSVSNSKTGKLIRSFAFHSGATLDVDWKDDVTFASCSSDGKIKLCSIYQDNPIRTYEGHRDEVNCVKFDKSGTLLASCSDDYSARVWSSPQLPVVKLEGHEKEVCTLRWDPNFNGTQTLATASIDESVKLWDVDRGICTRTLSRKLGAITTIEYSPDGQFLASGSVEGWVLIWNRTDNMTLKTIRGPGGVHQVAWNLAGDKISACFSGNSIYVIDIKKMFKTTAVV